MKLNRDRFVLLEENKGGAFIEKNIINFNRVLTYFIACSL